MKLDGDTQVQLCQESLSLVYRVNLRIKFTKAELDSEDFN